MNPVTVPCLCPPIDGQPRHESDSVTLREKLDFRTTVTLRKVVQWERLQDEAGVADVLGALMESYLLHCITAWSVVDAKGKPVEPSRGNIRRLLLEDDAAATLVSDEADALYSDKVLLPLVNPTSTSSPGMPTNGSTSATNGNGSKHRKQPRRSSISTSPTGAIATTGG